LVSKGGRGWKKVGEKVEKEKKGESWRKWKAD